ncbi:hypothetical protein GCM10027061_14370 [Nesterenkonia suensis]
MEVIATVRETGEAMGPSTSSSSPKAGSATTVGEGAGEAVIPPVSGIQAGSAVVVLTPRMQGRRSTSCDGAR